MTKLRTQTSGSYTSEQMKLEVSQRERIIGDLKTFSYNHEPTPMYTMGNQPHEVATGELVFKDVVNDADPEKNMDVLLVAENEYGETSFMEFFGVTLSDNRGYPVERIVSDTTYLYVAFGITPWTVGERPKDSNGKEGMVYNAYTDRWVWF